MARNNPLLILAGLGLAIASSHAATLTFAGNDHLPRKKIDAVVSPPDHPAALSAEEWDDWVDDATLSLSDLYGESGYLDAAFKVAQPQRGGLDSDHVALIIREGRRYAFGSVTVTTTDGSWPRIDTAGVDSRYGRAFARDLIFNDRRSILNVYGMAGFLHAKSTEQITVDTAGKTVALEFQVDPGPAVIFDTLMIRDVREGDSSSAPGITRPSRLRGIFGMRRGDTLSVAALGNFERKLKSTRTFNYVRLKDSLGLASGRGSALILNTEEKVPGELDAGLFFETQYGAGVSGNWSHGNIQGMLHEGRLGGSLAQRKQSLYAGYSSPLFFGTSLRFDDDFVTNWYQDSPLRQNARAYNGDFDITNSAKISRALATWLRAVSTGELTGKSEKLDTNRTERTFNLNFINSGFFSFVNDPVNPIQGIRFSLTWGNGGSFLNDAGYIQSPLSGRHNWLEVESAYYYPLFERLNLALRLDGGRFFAPGNINSERFFLGGPRSVRSYGWRKLCPEKDLTTGVCLTDGVMPEYILTSFEVRITPFSPGIVNPEGSWRGLLGMQLVPFVDFGTVWQVGRSPTESGMGRAIGMGLRYSLLSIFNLRLDYALDWQSRSHDQWVLDLAQAF